jgi:hypothetical protein
VNPHRHQLNSPVRRSSHGELTVASAEIDRGRGLAAFLAPQLSQHLGERPIAMVSNEQAHREDRLRSRLAVDQNLRYSWRRPTRPNIPVQPVSLNETGEADITFSECEIGVLVSPGTVWQPRRATAHRAFILP